MLWGLPRSAWIGFGIVMLGVATQFLSLAFPAQHEVIYSVSSLLIVIGLFGPGVLRELGVLKDQDEYQAGAARRAGHRAFLAGGVTILLLIHFKPWPDGPPMSSEMPVIPLSTVILVMLLTYLCSYLLEYWGARRGAAAILGTMAVIGAVGAALDELPDLWHFLVDLRFTAGFLLGIAISRRYPQVAGLYLFVVVFLILINHFAFPATDPSRLMLLAVLVLPPLAAGIAVIKESANEDA